jgi:hypothetical protein
MTSPNPTPVDFTIEHYGVFFLLNPQNDGAREHLQENVEPNAEWFGGRLVVEPRYIQLLVLELREAGWTVR